MKHPFVVAALLSLSGATHAETAPQLAVQLWSVKDELKTNFDGTLKALADAGIKGVEFAGEFGPHKEDFPALRRALDGLGLKAIGAHVRLSELMPDQIHATAKRYQVLGCHSLVVGYDKKATQTETLGEVAAILSNAAAVLKSYGMQTGYHNHAQEMADVGADTLWDRLALQTSAEVILQQDVGWTTFAGKDPVHYVKKYPGRTWSTHYKAKFPDSVKGRLPIIGQDVIDWRSLYQANASVGGTAWLIVEQEEYPNGLSQVDSVKASVRGLRQQLASLPNAPAWSH